MEAGELSFGEDDGWLTPAEEGGGAGMGYFKAYVAALGSALLGASVVHWWAAPPPGPGLGPTAPGAPSAVDGAGGGD